MTSTFVDNHHKEVFGMKTELRNYLTMKQAPSNKLNSGLEHGITCKTSVCLTVHNQIRSVSTQQPYQTMS